MKRPST